MKDNTTVQNMVLEAFKKMHAEGLLDDFSDDKVIASRNYVDDRIRWIITATLVPKDSDFDTKIKLRSAISNLADQISDPMGIFIVTANLSPEGIMYIELEGFMKTTR